MEAPVRVHVTKWGNSLGVRIPKDFVGRTGLAEGSDVEMEMEGDHIVIKVAYPRYRLDELLRDIRPEDMRDAFAWDEDVGREDVQS
jgi:antitoxin MazE